MDECEKERRRDRPSRVYAGISFPLGEFEGSNEHVMRAGPKPTSIPMSMKRINKVI